MRLYMRRDRGCTASCDGLLVLCSRAFCSLIREPVRRCVPHSTGRFLTACRYMWASEDFCVLVEVVSNPFMPASRSLDLPQPVAKHYLSSDGDPVSSGCLSSFPSDNHSSTRVVYSTPSCLFLLGALGLINFKTTLPQYRRRSILRFNFLRLIRISLLSPNFVGNVLCGIKEPFLASVPSSAPSTLRTLH